MSMRQKRRRRILILVGSAVVLAGLVAIGHTVRESQLDDSAREARDTAQAAWAEDDVHTALHSMGTFLGRLGKTEGTAQDYLLYARARRAEELPNGKHILDAIGILRRARTKDPADLEIQRELLDVYLMAGYRTESEAIVSALRAAGQSDLKLLRTQRDLLDAARKDDEAIAVCEEIHSVHPDEFADYFRTLDLKDRSNAVSRAQLREWVASVRAAHDGDPRFAVLEATAQSRLGSSEAAQSALDEAMQVAQSVDDLAFVSMLVQQLDVARRYADSLEVLETTSSKDPALRRECVRRLWYVGRVSEIPAMVAAWHAAGETLDPEVYALAALAPEAEGSDPEVFAGALAQADSDRASAWSTLIELGQRNAGAADAAEFKRLIAAVDVLAGSAVAQTLEAEAYLQRGELDLAVTYWGTATRLAPPWAMPARRAAEVLVDAGREAEAQQYAREAMKRAPGDVGAFVAFLRSAAGAIDELDNAATEELVSRVESVLEAAPSSAERVLPLYLGLLVRMDKPSAVRRLERILGAERAPTERTLLQLATLSDVNGLGVGERLRALSESRYGVTPGLALDRARSVSDESGSEAGLRVLEDLTASAGSDRGALQWKLVRATYLQAVGDPRAASAWTEISASHPASMEAQMGAIGCEQVWESREAVELIAARVRELTGERGVTWRIILAQLLMTAEAAPESDRAEAATLLTKAAEYAPNNARVRVLLAKALESLGNLTAAEEHLRVAKRLAPRNALVTLELARLAQLQGRDADVRTQLADASLSGPVSPAEAEHAAALFAVQGDYRSGLDMLTPMAERNEIRRSGLLLLARMHADIGELRRALEICDQLLERPDLASVELSARLYADAGDIERARATLRLLEGVTNLRPGDAALARSRFFSRSGTRSDAMQGYRDAVLQAPDRKDAWLEYLSFAIYAAEVEEIKSQLDAPGAQQLPGVQFLRRNIELCEPALQDVALRSFVLEALQDDTQHTALEEALRLSVPAWSDQQRRAAVAPKLSALADKHPRLLSLQLVAAGLHADAGDVERALEIISRTASLFPRSAATQRQRTSFLAQSGRWSEAEAAVLAWRALERPVGVESTLRLAEIHLRTGRAAQAVADLEALAQLATLPDETRLRIAVLRAVGQLRAADPGAAAETLTQAEELSTAWRIPAAELRPNWLGDADTLWKWLELLAAFDASDDVDFRFSLARAYGIAWESTAQTRFRDAARRRAEAMTESPDAPAEACMLAATLAQQANDLERSERLYRRAIAIDPSHLGAQNNLAMLLAGQGRWQEAIGHAKAALKAVPDDANLLDTLAFAHRKGGEFAEARARLQRAVELEPANPSWRVSLAETLAESGDTAEMNDVVLQIGEMQERGIDVPPELQQRLERLPGGRK